MSNLHRTVVTGALALAVGVVVLLPAHGREVARRATCQSNLKQIGLSLLMYAQANDGLLPPVNQWQEAAAEYIKNDQLFVCPEAGSRSLPHYFMVQSLSEVRVGALPDPRNTVLLYDGINGYAAAGPEGGVNVLFADGHVMQVTDVAPYGLTKVVARERPWEPSLREQLSELRFEVMYNYGLWIIPLQLILLWGLIYIPVRMVRRLRKKHSRCRKRG